MQIALFILTFLISLFIIYSINKKRRLLNNGELVLAFTSKVLMSCLYGYIFLHYYEGDDTWRLNSISIYEHNKLVQNTAQFFADLNPLDPLQRNESLSTGFHYLLLDYEFWMITKPLAIFNFVSGGNYFINVVFFSFIIFWGPYWLFSLMVRIFPRKRMLLLLFIFFFPPTLFWLSGLRADGMLFMFFSLMLLHFYHFVNYRSKKSFALFLLGFAGVLVYRDTLVLLLAPALLGWFLAVRYKVMPLPAFATIFGICIILFFLSALVPGTDGLPGMVAARQHEYLALEGNTRFALDRLQPTFSSYLSVLPQSAHNTLLRPYLWEAKGILQIVTALSILFSWLLVVLAIVRKETPWKEYLKNPFVLFSLFFGVGLYLVIGFTVPFPGAIVRYKVIAELLMFLTIVSNIRMPRKRVMKERLPATHDKK